MSAGDVLAAGRELFAAAGIDGAIAESWLSVAVRRDAMGDFVRGMSRLPGVLDRVDSGALVVTLSERLFSSRRMAGRIKTYLGQFDSYPGLHAQSSTAERSTGGISYPEDLLRELDAASEERGLAGRLASG